MRNATDLPLDRRIAPLVHKLRGAGFDTFTSCQGGEGHSFPFPTVRIDCAVRRLEQTAEMVAEFLVAEGLRSFSVSTSRWYANGPRPWQPRRKYSYIEVRLPALPQRWPWEEQETANTQGGDA